MSVAWLMHVQPQETASFGREGEDARTRKPQMIETMQSWCLLLNIDKREQHVPRNKLGEFMHCTYTDILFVHLLRLMVDISSEGEDQPR
jgi:hypothetical protein